MSEIELLCQAIQSQDSVENNGIKFLYMDENTIYRFQNNKMKPISKTLLNKAKKIIQQQSSPPTTKPKRGKGKKNISAQQQQEMNDSDDEVNDENENMNESEDEDEMVVVATPPKQTKQSRTQASRQNIQSSKSSKPKQPKNDFIPYGEINLDEYYNNKNRMEYMSREMERLNQKITKLKQYKHLVNKITGGGEIDDLPSNTQSQMLDEQQTQSRTSTSRQINDSLFM